MADLTSRMLRGVPVEPTIKNVEQIARLEAMDEVLPGSTGNAAADTRTFPKAPAR
jgi:hypothetical protein